MAEKRKLLIEIDKCFKKVDEGVETFEETMKKMQEANSDNQREKFQDDLKKEIKKLQRLRDQIKGWQNSSEIKDKDKLTSYRKLIEQRMEQFKDIERENKTKPHSKQGLSAEEKLDPREKEKSDTVEWLQCQIRCLEDEADKTESRIESMSTMEQTRKKGKRDDPKKGEKEKLRKLEDLRKHMERCKFHVSKLEVCMRLVNNETFESRTVMSALKVAVEKYIDALDPDNDLNPEDYDPENIGAYDELDLDSFAPQLVGPLYNSADADEKIDANTVDGRLSPAASPAPLVPRELEEINKQRHASGDGSTAIGRQSSLSRSTPATPLKLSNSPPPSATPATPPPPPTMPYNLAVGIGTKGAKGAVLQSSVKQPVEVVRQATGVISVTTTTTTTSSVTQQQHQQAITAATAHQVVNNDENSAPSPANADVPPNLSTQRATLSPSLVVSSRSPTPDSNAVKRFSLPSSASNQHEIATLKAMAAQVSAGAEVIAMQNSTAAAVSHQVSLNVPLSSQITMRASPLQNSETAVNIASAATAISTTTEIDQNALRQVLRMSQQEIRNQQPQTAIIPSWLGASPLGRAPVTPDFELQLKFLDSGYQRMPMPMDSEKPRSYLPKMPCATAVYYPHAPPANADTLEYYLRLSPETLFFAFYYMEGSRAQLLAAKALKKLSWRFHTKYLMWFQRHEEPKQITDDYEQGTYVYFDFEKWSQRKKEQFTFEYRYLEDRDFD